MTRLDADLRALWSGDPERLAYAGLPDRQGIGGVPRDRRAPAEQPVGSSGSGDAP
ncbi:hypothetical protein DSM104299_03929 [Baekduia alba]|uniref:hypothetical protein n=1 Tax=Baekduia alba TaxID=2997333 RepID=UPI0023408960|nr:hypothetical protein [Baekduia alba]WCB95186.1 hypothetical protein DSM104299_03929 [Baekduia alba]